MVTSLKDTLQRIVLEVNRWPFGLSLMRIPYYAAVFVFTRWIRRFPLVIAVYARNSYAYGTWIPGRSDIDLTLILRSGFSPKEELDTVCAFRENYSFLCRCFPMLGEVEIINQEHLDAWARFTILGYESRDWLCIYGHAAIPVGYLGDAEQKRRDRLNHGLNIYRHLMVPVLGSAKQDVLVRCMKKILRYLDTPTNQYAGIEIDNMRPTQLHATAIRFLQNAISEQVNSHQDRIPLDLDRVLGRTLLSSVDRGAPPSWLRGEKSISALIESVLIATYDPSKIYYLLRENLDDKQLERCVNAISANEGSPIMMQSGLLLHFLEHIDPLEYLSLLQSRTILWGNDPLEPRKDWQTPHFERAVRASATSIFLLPYKPSLQTMKQREFNNLLFGWVLRYARFFDDGVMEFDYNRLREYWVKAHPQYKIDMQWNGSDDYLQRFTLLRNILDHIRSGLIKPVNTREIR